MNAKTATSLKAMAADRDDAGVKKSDKWLIDPARIVEIEGFNLRDYDDPDVIAQIEAFADAYAKGRPVPPLIVWTDSNGNISPVEGHLRRRGALLCRERGHDLRYVECISFKGNDAERNAFMLRCADGLAIKPLKTAQGYLRLSRMGLSNSEIAEQVGRTLARVEQLLVLARAESDVHALVKSNKVSADAAIEAVRLYGEEAGKFLQAELDAGRKASRQTIRGAGIPPKVATTVKGAFTEIFSKRSKVLEGLARWEKGGMPKGQKIEVDAEALLALKEAHDSLMELQNKRDTRDLARSAKNKQKEIEGLE